MAETLIVSQSEQGNVFAMYLMANVRLSEGDVIGAVTMWQQVGDEGALLRAASQAQQAGHLDDALVAYEAVWTVDPESGIVPLADFLDYYKKDYGSAENLLRFSLATFPNSRYRSAWSIRLGNLFQRQKRWDEAIAMYESVIVLTPDAWSAHLGIGWAKYERGDGFQEAMSEFQEVINTSESLGNGQFAIAQMMTRENRFQEADAWFVKAFVLNPNSWSWNVARGNAARQAGNLVLALTIYQDTLKLFPDNAWIYYEMAYTYQLKDQSALALAAIE